MVTQYQQKTLARVPHKGHLLLWCGLERTTRATYYKIWGRLILLASG